MCIFLHNVKLINFVVIAFQVTKKFQIEELINSHFLVPMLVWSTQLALCSSVLQSSSIPVTNALIAIALRGWPRNTISRNFEVTDILGTIWPNTCIPFRHCLEYSRKLKRVRVNWCEIRLSLLFLYVTLTWDTQLIKTAFLFIYLYSVMHTSHENVKYLHY